MLISFAIIMGSICLFTQGCIWSKRTLEVVHFCPTNKEETTRAARIKGCDVIAFRQNCTNSFKFKYHCLYSYIEKSLVEVCAMETIIHGVCIVYDGRLSNIQPIYNVKCRDISSPCPEKYLSTEGHLYATCPALMNVTFFDTRDPKIPEPPKNESQIVMILVVSLTIVIISSIILLAIFRKKLCWKKSEDNTLQGSAEEMQPLNESKNERNKSKHHADNRKEQFLGTSEVWKTTLTDEFSTLTRYEVSVLFCFLCSDSGPPDFTDTEWLDLLNKIRQLVYREYNPVTSEGAQQTLDRLKSRDYFWEDQDKITKDTKDETIYRIASIENSLLFRYSSYDTASVYLRSKEYNREPGEKCVSSRGCDDLLILRLQMNILTHVTMEDMTINDKILKNLNIPENILKNSEDKRKQFLQELRGGEAVHYRERRHGSVDHVTWLWRHGFQARPDIVRSCIGRHLHWDIYIIDNKSHRKPSSYHLYQSNVRCLLYTLLSVENFELDVNEQSHRTIRDRIKDRYFPDITDGDWIDLPDGITETRDGVITFISDDIRHDVMYAFVTECLVEDNDLEFFMTIVSSNVISEYCRSWDYKRSNGERCLYLPAKPGKLYTIFIDKLQLDIISHCTVSDRGIHNKIKEQLGVPEEVLKWDQEARKRYVEYAKKGTQTVHHARGMIVGCAGAGKTTLLKRLLGCSEEEIKEVKSTEGLEVHDEVFEICDETKSLKVKTRNIDHRKNGGNATDIGPKTLTFFDFGGQSAYYACHQIYLTRRAFYVVVVDASKCLDQKVDKKVCDQEGSVFSGWTYGDYFVFWIKSIHTYCGSDNEKEPTPIISIVATHWEKEGRMFKTKDDLIKSLKHQLPKSSYLSQYVREDNCHCTQLCLPLDDVKDCFFDIANQTRWEENIPKEWFLFGIEINQKKHSERILKIWDIKTKVPEITPKGQKNYNKVENETKDMLRYYHDAGKALYFPENDLESEVIIDVQWFIDAFKHIITDELHFKDIPVSWEDWLEFYKTGHLQDKLLTDIWKHKDEEVLECSEKRHKNYDIIDVPYGEDHRYLQYHRKSLLMFMQRLGLLVVGKEYHYVPCMNRKELEEKLLDLMNKSDIKSSVLIYRFEFLPFFLFFRLVVACMQIDGWNVLRSDGTSCLYRNAAFFSYMEYNIVLSVTEESIQIQVFSPMQGYDLETVKTYCIQESVEEILNDFARSFHRKIMFVRGFRCRMDKGKTIAIDIKDHFLPQKDIPKKDCNMICPLHPFDRHIINTAELTKFWKVLE